MANFETVEVTTDLLIVGGGMAACGAAVEASYWAKKNGLKVTLVDKAAVDRSGAVAMGLSAINQYVGLRDGQNTIKDYVDYVRNDLMGITREDLVPCQCATVIARLRDVEQEVSRGHISLNRPKVKGRTLLRNGYFCCASKKESQKTLLKCWVLMWMGNGRNP